MRKKAIIHITIIAFIVGLMVAIQYNIRQKPTNERDTRDVWAIREEISEEKKRHSELLSELASLKEIIRQYESPKENKGDTLKETVQSLREEAGLTEVKGPGVRLTIQPASELIEYGYSVNQISPDLLNRLVNEIYKYNGKYLEIDGNRIVHTTAIRDINGKTTINSIPIQSTSIEICVITDTHIRKLRSYIVIYILLRFPMLFILITYYFRFMKQKGNLQFQLMMEK